MPDKSLLREEYLTKRGKIPLHSRREKSRRILRKLSRARVFRRAEHVAFYYGTGSEVETRSLLRKCLKDQKVYLPKVGPEGSMTLRRVRSLSGDLKKGAYHILEPKVFCEERPAGRMDVILVPGVAFDRKGGRLGRGGGYYDRLLKRAGKVPKIGLCFREQIVKKVPMRPHDVKVDRVITD